VGSAFGSKREDLVTYFTSALDKSPSVPTTKAAAPGSKTTQNAHETNPLIIGLFFGSGNTVDGSEIRLSPPGMVLKPGK